MYVDIPNFVGFLAMINIDIELLHGVYSVQHTKICF